MTDLASRRDPQSSPQRRRSDRVAVDLVTVVLRDGRPDLEVRLVDLSPFGFHARHSESHLARDDRLRIDLPLLGDMPARVIWTIKGCFGCRFSVPIEERAYLRLLAVVRACDTGWRR